MESTSQKGAVHAVLETHLVEDEELGLRSEGGGVGDTGGFSGRPRRAGDLTRVAEYGSSVSGSTMEKATSRVLCLRNGSTKAVSTSGDQLHVGLVDGPEAPNGGTIERHAVGESVLQNSPAGTVKCC